MTSSQQSPAVVLRWRPYGESDKIATLLTRDFGKLTGIAKGAVRSRRRFANSLEPLARVRVHFRQRPQASLAFLESCELLAPTTPFTEPTRLAYGSYLAELVDRLSAEGQAAPELYVLLEEGLAELERGPATGAFLRGFELKLLRRAGYGPRFDRCAACDGSWPDSGAAYLDPRQGAFLCAGCRPAGIGIVEVSTALLARLAALDSRPFAEYRGDPLDAAAAETARLTGHLLALHLDRPLRSLVLIRQLGPDSL